MPRDDDDDDELTSDFEGIGAMADRLKLTGKDRSNYIHEHMTGLGYRSEARYVRRGKDDEDDDKGSKYSARRRSNSRRDSNDW